MAISNPYTGGIPRKTCLHAHLRPPAGLVYPSYGEKQGDGDDGNHLLNSSYVASAGMYQSKTGETYQSFASIAAAAGFDAVAITSHEHLENAEAALSAVGILWIPSAELHDDITRESDTHFTGIGVYDSTAESLGIELFKNIGGQAIINAVNAKSGMAIVAHPNASVGNYYITLPELKALTGFNGIEVVNGRELIATGYYTEAQVYADGTGGGTNMIDPILAEVVAGTRSEFVSLIGVSDFHRFLQYVAPTWYPMTLDSSFQMIYSDALTIAGIRDNLKAGNSYATEGPLLASAPTVTGDTITISSVDSCTCQWIKNGAVVAQSDTANTSFSFTADGTEGYVRAKLTRVSDGLNIWTQPFYITPKVFRDVVRIEKTATGWRYVPRYTKDANGKTHQVRGKVRTE